MLQCPPSVDTPDDGVLHRLAIDQPFDLLALHRLNPQRYPFLLESAARGLQGNYDILFACPGETLRLERLDDFDFLDTLDRYWSRDAQGRTGADDLPFHGGWFIYLGYELAAQVEPQLRLPTASGELPVACATRIPAAVIRDHAKHCCWVIAETPEDLALLRRDIAHLPSESPQAASIRLDAVTEDEPRAYLEAVERILEYIRDGDVFQVNLSRQWRAEWPHGLDAASLYAQLRKANPGPFNGLIDWGEQAVISSSPERLIALNGDRIQSRPIAGTRPRGEHPGADRQISDELLRHPKEQAEHIMLIDLERNDLGRVAQPGTVKVNELMTLESYATVHHIVSNVEARLRPGITPGQVIRAVFPGGTITGCPKVRCMEIIAELEAQPRGAYTGSMGYLNHNGSMDLNILIRTLVRNGRQLNFRAGAGIVYDSVAQGELSETRDKAAGMIRALKGLSGE